MFTGSDRIPGCRARIRFAILGPVADNRCRYVDATSRRRRHGHLSRAVRVHRARGGGADADQYAAAHQPPTAADAGRGRLSPAASFRSADAPPQLYVVRADAPFL